jgi:hypothetical protein
MAYEWHLNGNVNGGEAMDHYGHYGSLWVTIWVTMDHHGLLWITIWITRMACEWQCKWQFCCDHWNCWISGGSPSTPDSLGITGVVWGNPDTFFLHP